MFGVGESNGVVDAIAGIVFGDTEQQQFLQIVTSGISPRIQALEHSVVSLRNGNVVLVVKIAPDSYLHQVKYDDNRYYKRTGTITLAMESSDVETFFTSKGPANRNEEIEQLINDYRGDLRSKKYFRGVSGQGVCALTIVPETASFKIDFGNLPSNMDLLFQPLYCSGWDSEVTGRAYFTFGRQREAKTPYAATEITEFGELKAFNTLIFEPYGKAPLPESAVGYIPSIAYEQELIKSTHKYLNSFADLGVSPPFTVNISLISLRSYIMHVDPVRFSNFGRILQQDDVLPNSIRFMSSSEFDTLESVAIALKPAFDFIWREFGFKRSFNYNDSGDWAPHR